MFASDNSEEVTDVLEYINNHEVLSKSAEFASFLDSENKFEVSYTDKISNNVSKFVEKSKTLIGAT